MIRLDTGKPKPFHYWTCCVNATGQDIEQMVDAATKITYKTFTRHCNWQDWAKSMGYALNNKKGLALKDDWHVGYYKSKYQSRPCYYLDHSAIEYIWIAI